MKRTSRTAYHLAIAILSAVLFVAAVCLPLARAVTNSDIMEKAFFRYADTSASGITQESYRALSIGITDFLAGRAETPQVLVYSGGITSDAFSDKELAHLKDVRGLVTTAVQVSWIFGGCLVIVSGVLVVQYIGKRKKTDRQTGLMPICRSVIAGFGIFTVLAAATVIWAVMDFSGLFVLFHRAVFSNGLWMLDPATDLLIQLMPLEFFKYYATRVLLTWLLLDLTMLLPAGICLISGKKNGL